HRDPAGANDFDNSERPHQVDKRLNFSFLPGDFDDHVLRSDIDDSTAENFGEFADFAPFSARRRFDFNQHQVALDEILRADVVDADDGDNFFQLPPDLLQHAIVADDDERHP